MFFSLKLLQKLKQLFTEPSFSLSSLQLLTTQLHYIRPM
jgi:hypothetical protein